MSTSESRKRATMKWDKANMTTVSTKVRKEKAIQFKEACKKLHTIPNRVLLHAINETIEKAEGQV